MREPSRRRVTFTVSNVPTLQPEKGAATMWWDRTVPGLFLRVSPPSPMYPKGVRAYGVWYRVRGHARQKGLGRHPIVGLAAVRERAREILAAARLRRIDILAAPHDLTLVGLVEMFVKASRKQVPRVRGDRTIAEYARFAEQYFRGTRIGDAMPVADLTRNDLRDLLMPHVARAPVGTQRVRQMLRVVFSWALDQEPPVVEKDPTRGLERFAEETSRERTLRDEEIVILWRACAAEISDPLTLAGGKQRRRAAPDMEAGAQRAALARLILVTGARPGEASMLEWPELEEASRLWHVPAEHRKGRRGRAHAHVFPLSQLALEVLRDLREVTGSRKRAFLFTNRLKRYSPHWVVPLQARAKAMGLTAHWTPHDLRRTCATGLAQLGVSRSVIALVLGHEMREGGASTSVYDRHDRMPERRAALDAWSAHVTDLATKPPTS